MHILNTIFTRKIRFYLLIIAVIMNGFYAEAQIYYHNFGTAAISTHPYTVAPTTIDSHLSGSSWTNSVSSWTSNTGATGEAIRLTTAAPATITLTFNIAANYQVDITSFDFWTVRSALGPQNWSMTINGINVGSGTTAAVGAALGNTAVANTISGLTGTITVVISLSGQTGNGTYRLDDFTLFGTVSPNCTAATITSFSPTSGPQNTLVTINGSGFQAGTGTSAVNFNGIPATSFTVVSDNVIKAYIPAGNTSGNISVVTNGCEGFSTGSFTLIVTTPNIVYATDLYISEIYDAQAGSGGVIEIYNGTASTINLSGYSIVRHGDIGGPSTYTLNLTGSIPPGAVFLINVGTTAVPCPGLTYGQIYPSGGFNSNDQFELVHNSSIIDSVQISSAIITGQPGYSITRDPGAIGPQPVFNSNDWILTGTEDCSDLGGHTVMPPNPLSAINAQPTSRIICENGTTTFSVTLANPAGYTFQWKVQSGTGNWINVVNSANYSGALTSTLTLNSVPATFNNNQYYCQVTSPSGIIVTYAAQLQVNGANTPPTLSTTPPTCLANGFTTITDYSASNTYTFSPTGPTVGSGGIITGAIVGTNYSVSVSNGCPGTSASFTNLAQLPTPLVPTLSTTPPTCTADGFTVITNYNAANNYTFSPPGPVPGTGGTITSTVLGTAYTLTASNGGCTSAPSLAFTNLAQLTTPLVPTLSTTPPTCTADGFTVIINYNAANNYTFSPNGPIVGAGGTITGVVLGTAYTVTSSNGGCTSAASASFTNLAQLATPLVPTLATTPPTCTVDGFTAITNYNGASTYIFSPTGPVAGTGGTITGAVLGTAYTVTASNGGCTSASSPAFTNLVQLPTPLVPTLSTTPPTCTVDGFTSITNYNAVNTYTFSPTGPVAGIGGTITSAVLGTAYTVIASNGGCTSAASASFTNLAQLATPLVPTLSTTPPSCTADGFTAITNYNASNTYTFSPTGPVAGTVGTITGSVLGTAYTVTVSNGGCTSAPSLAFTDLPQLPTPLVPTLSTTPPSCTSDGFTVISNYNAANTYTFSPTGPVVGTGGTITGAVLGTAYTVIASNGGCTSAASASFTNLAQLATPLVPTLATTPPTCTADGFTAITNYNAASTYTFSPTGPVAGIGGTITGAVLGTAYTVTVSNGGCTSAPSLAFTNLPQLPTPAVPTLITTPPTCTVDGFTTITNYNAVNTYTFSPTGPVAGIGGTITSAVLGTAYTVTASNSSCISGASGAFTNNPYLASIVFTNPPSLQACDPNNDGFVTFNLAQLINGITGGNPSYTVTFHETPADAMIGGTTILTPLSYDNINPWLQTIYIRVTPNASPCFQILTLQLIINPTPEATEPADYELCDYSGAAGIEPFDLTTRIPEILGAINPALTTVTFYTTLTDAQTPTGAIVGITNYLSGNTTLYVRVETTATGCFDIVALNLVVNPLPNSLQPNYPQYSLCDTDQANIGYETFDLGSKIDDILLGQLGMDVTFWPSLGDAQNGTGQITNLMYTNTIQYVQTIGITITNHATGCFVISTMDLRVEPLPTPIPPIQPYTICDGNQDGFSCGFDLSTLMPDILQGANYTLTFYETPTDAATGNPVTAINPNTPYCNIDPFMQLLYVRAEDNITHCFSVMPIQLNVDPSPMAPIQLDDIVICDDDNNPQSATRLVDLTQRTADVLAQQPLPVGSYTVTYYKLQSDAQGPSNPIIPASSYFGSDGEEIWVRVENNASQCFNIGSFHLVINTPLLLTTPTPLSMCDDDAAPNDQYHVFDLTVKNLQIAPGGQMVTYYPSLALAQGGVAGTEIATPTAYQNMNPQHPAVQTLGVVVTTADGCKSITTLDIRVLPIPTPRTNPPALAPKCDDNNPGDMLEVFDLTQNEAYIRNGDPNLTFHYYLTLADAQGPLNEIANPSAASVGGNVWIRVENNRVDYQGNHCYVLVEQALTVNPLPQVIQPLAPYRVCDNDADGLAQFDLTNPALAPLILGTATTNQQPADYTITYHATPGNAATGAAPLVSPYTNIIPTSDTVYIRVVNNATGCVNASGVLPLAVEPYATATGPQSFTDCDNYGDPYDGVHQIDLTQFEAAILNGQNPAVFLVSYYRTQADADAGTSPLTAAEEVAYTTDPDTDTIWVKVENSSNTITPYCYALTTINITVERYPDPIINTPNGVHTICVDFLTGAVLRPLTLDSGIANTAGYTFEWFEAGAPTAVIGTDATYEVNTADAAGATRSYTVHVTSISALACDTTSAPFDVIQSGPAVIPAGTIGYTVSNAFSNTQIITVSVEGYGTYEYSLDDGPRQAGNVFEDVSFGTHTIHVWDTEGGIAYSCEQLIIEEVQIIDYPHYFTPNGDGVHDTWNIVGLGGQPGAKIYIFDRYGKLLKQISSTGEGWNGTYNGHLLPSDDYWFTVDFMEDAVIRQFKAHFTLKR